VYWLLVRRALTRKKLKLVLTQLSLLLAFFLFAMLEGVNVAFQHAMTGDAADRLMVLNKIGMFTDGLPRAYQREIAAVRGVTTVTPVVSMAAYYQEPSRPVEAFGVDPAVVFRLYPEWHSEADQVLALQRTRAAAIVGRRTAAKYDWKRGDVVPLTSGRLFKRDGSPVWPVEIVGFYDDIANGATDVNVLVNVAYLQEGRADPAAQTADFYIAGVGAPLSPAEVGQTIDERFANSAAETESQTEKEFGVGLLKQIGDVNALVGQISAAMFFALLFITGAALSQSVSERAPELAALQAMGYRVGRIGRLVLGEALALCGMGAVAGVVVAALSFRKFEPYVGVATLPARAVIEALVVATLLALATVIGPLWKVYRSPIVNSLAERGAA
jgi:putative ABC transport system permease protein